MAYCMYCGTQVDGVRDCPACGARFTRPAAGQSRGTEAAARDIADNRVMAALSYLGPLVLVPYFAARESPFAQYHAVRGMNLFLLEAAYAALSAALDLLLTAISWKLGAVFSAVFGLCAMAFLALSLIGILHVCRGERKGLPVVGHIRIVRR